MVYVDLLDDDRVVVKRKTWLKCNFIVCINEVRLIKIGQKKFDEIIFKYKGD